MLVQPYLFFDGRCEEAIEFYRKALGAEVGMMMRYKDSPEPPPPGMVPPGSENKMMHASLRIGDTTVMASDGGCQGKPSFQGFSLSLTVPSEAEADRRVRRAGRRRAGADAVDQDLLLAALRHARRPLRRRLDGHGRAQGRGLAMRFMVLLKADKSTEAGVPPSTELLAAMGKYNEELAKAGVLLAGEGLQPSSKGARVKFSGGRQTVTDGPFPELRELIAGFWMFQVNSKEEAIEWVKRCPDPLPGGEHEIEIRQVFEASDFETMTPELREKEEELRAAIEFPRRR